MISRLPAFGHRPPADPHALARTILAEPRFRVRVAPVRTAWWTPITKWLGDRWNQLVDAFTHHVKIGTGASIAIGDLLLIAVIALVVIVAVRLLMQYVREAAPADHARRLEPHASSEDLYAEAQRAAQHGEYARAIALLFSGALAALDVRGVVHDDPSRTVNECRREVRARAPQCSASFDIVARAFSAVVYADAPVSAEQWERARDAYQQVIGAAGRAA